VEEYLIFSNFQISKQLKYQINLKKTLEMINNKMLKKVIKDLKKIVVERKRIIMKKMIVTLSN